MDNVFSLWLQRRIGNVHPLITIFGVFVGVPLFGFIGLIFGPLLISIFILLMRIYRVEFIAPEESLEANTSMEDWKLKMECHFNNRYARKKKGRLIQSCTNK